MTDDARARAIVRAFRLIHDVQAGLPEAAEGLVSLDARAQKEGWDDVERACVLGEAVRLWIAGDPDAADRVAELVERSQEAGDDVMLAVGLALRSDQGFGSADLLDASTHDADLARAVVMLEQESGRPCERITAHTACAIAFGNRWLFELAHEQYEAALAIGAAEPAGSLGFLLAPIRFNLAEEQVSWASKLYELGDVRGVEDRWSTWQAVVAGTAAYPMTERWKVELDALGLVLRGIAGLDPTQEAIAILSRIDGRPDDGARARGLLRLAIAVGATTSHHDDGCVGEHTDGAAASAIQTALTSISPTVHPFMYDLALFLAASVEARPGADAGLRYARRALDEQWAKREASLRAMRSQITSVRVASERDVLSRHARLDDLTGIANRRALEAFVSELVHRGVTQCALVLFDVDSFKAVNDRHGHLAGDLVLVRVAQVLARGVRSSDLAVRLGGDEFAVILADVGPASARARADALVRAFDTEPVGDIASDLRLRVSAGVALGRPEAIMDIWGAADAALYQAKSLGGHVVGVAPEAVG